MGGQAIGAQALGWAGPRCFATEYGGPRPGGTRGDRTTSAGEDRTHRASRP